MKRHLAFALILLVLVLAACSKPWVQSSELMATGTPQVNLANPASVYCEQNGNKLEIRTDPDGNQSGICVFPDGSTCDEWAFFRGECGVEVPTSSTLAPPAESTSNASGGYIQSGTSEPIANWWGVIKGTDPGAQFDDYFERQDLGGVIYFGIESLDPVIKAQIEDLRDSGKIVHLYGILFSNVPDYNGSQVQVNRLEVE